MKKRFIVLGILFVLSMALLFEAGLLLYLFGEPSEIRLGGGDAEFLIRLAEQIRLGHMIEVAGGELSFFYGGQLHQLHVLSVQERLNAALGAAFKGDYGPAVSYSGAVADSLWPAFGKTMLAYLGLLTGSSLTMLSLKVKLSNKKAKIVVAGVAGALFLAAHLVCGLAPSLYVLGIALLALSLGALGFVVGQGKPWKQNLAWIFLLTAFGGLNLLAFGAYIRNLNATLEGVLIHGFMNADNHLYSVSFFYVLLVPILLLFAGLFLRAAFVPAKKAPKTESIEENIEKA